jgi:small subunit ribosomal protein S4
LEKPFRNYYDKASKISGITGENLMIMLERRIDNVVYRLGLARTRREARQLVSHKNILVNGRQVKTASMLIRAGDKVEVREKSRSLQRYKEILEVTDGRIVPEWLEADHENLCGSVKQLPTREMITDIPVNETLIVELYSK